jgi:hypothetical protein
MCGQPPSPLSVVHRIFGGSQSGNGPPLPLASERRLYEAYPSLLTFRVNLLKAPSIRAYRVLASKLTSSTYTKFTPVYLIYK